MVVYDGTPLPGVTIVLHTPRGNITHVTDSHGNYEFLNVAPGVYRIEANLSGMERRVAKVTVKRGVATGLTMKMSPAHTEPITVTATAPLAPPDTFVSVKEIRPVDHDSAWTGVKVNAITKIPDTAFYAPIVENVLEREAGDEIRYDGRQLPHRQDFMDRHDAWVSQLGHLARLVEKALELIG